MVEKTSVEVSNFAGDMPSWFKLLACPDCRNPLQKNDSELQCSGCGRRFRKVFSAPDLSPKDEPELGMAPPSFQSWGTWLIGRLYSQRYSHPEARLRQLLADLTATQWGLNAGSSNTRLHEQVLNLDIRPSAGVDVVGNALCLPFADNSFRCVVSQEVVEHLPDPNLAMREVYRVLAPGGWFFLQVPFVVGIHDYPHDYWRFTDRGLEMLLKRAGFQVDEIEPTDGSGKSMYFVTVEYAASIASSIWSKLYIPVKGVMAVLAEPLRLANFVTRKKAANNRIPVGFYAVARKP
jgi:SAM-dependent methyltransferase